jgi:hypothetical protein
VGTMFGVLGCSVGRAPGAEVAAVIAGRWIRSPESVSAAGGLEPAGRSQPKFVPCVKDEADSGNEEVDIKYRIVIPCSRH